MLVLQSMYIEPRSSLGVAPDAYKVVDNGDDILFMTPTPGLGDHNVSVKVINNSALVIKNMQGSAFTPKFRFVFDMPKGFQKEDIQAFITDGILYVKLIKNS